MQQDHAPEADQQHAGFFRRDVGRLVKRARHAICPGLGRAFLEKPAHAIHHALGPGEQAPLRLGALVAQDEDEAENDDEHEHRHAAGGQIPGHLACGGKYRKTHEHNDGKAAEKADLFQKDDGHRLAHVQALAMRPGRNQDAARRARRGRHVVGEGDGENQRDYVEVGHFLVHAAKQLLVGKGVPEVAAEQAYAGKHKGHDGHLLDGLDEIVEVVAFDDESHRHDHKHEQGQKLAPVALFLRALFGVGHFLCHGRGAR